MTPTFSRAVTTCVFGAVLTLAACGGEQKRSDTAAGTTSPEQSAAGAGGAVSKPGAAGELTPDAGAKVITVQMITDGASNRFEPADFDAKRGDVIRYTLQQGVHNVHFVADSNKTAQRLPTEPSDMAQLPGQTIDVKVDWPPGKYFYQCDPHALLGMVGHVTVAQ